MKALFDPRFPRERGWPRAAIAISILAHVLLFLGPVESRPPTIAPPPDRTIVLTPRQEPPSEPSFIFVLPRSTRPDRRPETGVNRGPRPVAREPVPVEPFVPVTPRLERPPIDSGTAEPRSRGYARVAPDYGNGVLWVRPVPISPEVLARRL